MGLVPNTNLTTGNAKYVAVMRGFKLKTKKPTSRGVGSAFGSISNRPP